MAGFRERVCYFEEGLVALSRCRMTRARYEMSGSSFSSLGERLDRCFEFYECGINSSR